LDTDILVLDNHPLKDLKIFGSNSTETLLFKFCDLTHSDGGAKVLYQRMQKPWSSVAHIKDGQATISFVMQQRACFSKIPSAYAMNHAHAYLHEVMPVIMDRNPMEFGFSAISLRSNHDRYYYKIITGVQITNGLIRRVKVFVNQPTLASAAGEIATYINEMREILNRPRLKKLVDGDVGG